MGKTFQEELTELLNKHSKENGSNTPDFILAEYLCACLENFNKTVAERERWYGTRTLVWQKHRPKNSSESMKPTEQQARERYPYEDDISNVRRAAFLSGYSAALSTLPEPQEQGWVDVKTKLPEKGVDVYTWDGVSVKRGHLAHDYEREFYEENSGIKLDRPLWDDAEWFGQSTKITHWQPYSTPLPPVPQTK